MQEQIINRFICFQYQKNISFNTEKEIPSDGWHVCSPETSKNFSAIAYMFGREIYKKYNVPVGLILSSWGGTPAESWISEGGLKHLPEQIERITKYDDYDLEAYQNYLNGVKLWVKEFGNVDRGNLPDQPSWKEVDLNTVDWETMKLPNVWSRNPEFKGYGGAVWFRKEIDISTGFDNSPVVLNLGRVAVFDSVFCKWGVYWFNV